MTEDFLMRFRLQQVLVYRKLCQSIRAGGRSNVFFAGIMLALAYYTFNPRLGGILGIIFVLYLGLAFAELSVGLFKWLFASAEGVLLDAGLLLIFATWNLSSQALFYFLIGKQPDFVIVFLGIIMFSGAVRRFKDYTELRRLFADRPSREQLAWFDDLIDEIRRADPATDDLALDLPTRPHWKAKLLGSTAFFVSGREVLVAGPLEFGLTPDPRNSETDRLLVHLHLNDRVYKPFELDEASWANYRKWVAQQAATT